MFTGIITAIGTLSEIKPKPEGGARFVLEVKPHKTFAHLATGDSLACNGICFTISDAKNFTMDASPETLAVTTASTWQVGQALNLEAALRVGDALGGHFVTGHVDGVGEIMTINKQGDNWRVVCRAPKALAPFIAKKGSVAMDGVSLTINGVDDYINDKTNGEVAFEVMLIPHTWQNTIASDYTEGTKVNLEADMLARYALRTRQTKPKGEYKP